MKSTLMGMVSLFCLAGTVSAASAADGAGIFAAHCVSCHGATGHADTPASKALKVPALAGDTKVAAAGQDDVVALIKASPKHTTVLGKLGPDDVTAVAGYVKQMAGGK